MLEVSLKNLIKKILQTEVAHIKNPNSKSMLSRDWEFIFFDYEDWVVLSVSTNTRGGYWMLSTLYPQAKLGELKKTLPEFSKSTTGGGYSHVIRDNEHWIEPYWDEGSGFNGSELPLYFRGHYEGNPKGEENYVEFNQLVTHVLGLNWSSRKNAYCEMDEYGDEDEKIKLIKEENIELILMKRQELDKLLYLGKWVLVRYFSF